MVDGPVVERGVLTTPAQTWDIAAGQAEVIKQLAGQATVGLAAADVAAAELGVSRRQVYALVRRWRAGGRRGVRPVAGPVQRRPRRRSAPR